MEYELYHYGVKGMKWGVRKFQEKSRELERKKTAFKKAKKEYNKSFNKANNRSIGAYSPIKKHREAANQRWVDVADKGVALNKAKSDYKAAKKEIRKNTTVEQKLNRGAKVAGKVVDIATKLYIADLLYTGGAGNRAVKAGANHLKNKMMDKMFNATILDANGRPIYRYNM